MPDVVALGTIPNPETKAKPLDEAKELAWKGKWNLPFYPDTWDGYEWARERFYTQARAAGADDLIFLTGDSHSFWANRLADGSGRPAGAGRAPVQRPLCLPAVRLLAGRYGATAVFLQLAGRRLPELRRAGPARLL